MPLAISLRDDRFMHSNNPSRLGISMNFEDFEGAGAAFAAGAKLGSFFGPKGTIVGGLAGVALFVLAAKRSEN